MRGCPGFPVFGFPVFRIRRSSKSGLKCTFCHILAQIRYLKHGGVETPYAPHSNFQLDSVRFLDYHPVDGQYARRPRLTVSAQYAKRGLVRAGHPVVSIQRALGRGRCVLGGISWPILPAASTDMSAIRLAADSIRRGADPLRAVNSIGSMARRRAGANSGGQRPVPPGVRGVCGQDCFHSFISRRNR
jgi:hypothetical protein